VLELYPPGEGEAWLASFRFRIDVRPRYCETDALGHVSNVVYPVYLEQGRLQYFIAAGDPEPGPFAFAHVAAELTLRYVAACFYDEALEVRSKLVALGRTSATMEQAIVGADGSIRALARVSVVHSGGEGIAPWTHAQRAALIAFEPSL
jgi:acyl-CoA thioester hydrolase